MKKFSVALLLILACANFCNAEEIQATESVKVQEEQTVQAEQIIEMDENKVILNIMKQPLNENSKQKIVLKKNWFVVNVQVNGKVKVQPITGTYEVE